MLMSTADVAHGGGRERSFDSRVLITGVVLVYLALLAVDMAVTRETPDERFNRCRAVLDACSDTPINCLREFLICLGWFTILV